MGEWIPAIVSIISLLIVAGGTVAVSSAKIARIEEKLGNMGELIKRNVDCIMTLDSSQRLTDIRYSEIKKDLEYIKMELVKLLKQYE